MAMCQDDGTIRELLPNEQLIGNKSGAKYITACIKCGTFLALMLLAHRDKKGNVAGFVFCCRDCFPLIADGTIGLKERTERKRNTNIKKEVK